MTSINSHIGPYKITEVIGDSLSSTVCRATNSDKDQDVMLKVFVHNNTDSKSDLERFIEEGQNAERLNHAGISSFYEAGEANGEHFIAHEFVTERTLSNYFEAQEKRAIPVDDTIEIIHQIAAGLEYIHNQGFIHRDIKPDNLLYSEDGRVLISDFSLAKHIDTNDSRSIFTIAGGSIGTLDYISPEHAKGEMNIDHRSDIYSLAVIAYELLSGKLPHSAPSQHELLYKIIYEAPPTLDKIVPHIPAGIAYVIDRALSKDIPIRYGSASSFAEALEEGKTWVPSAAAYEFLEEAAGSNTYSAASQSGQKIPHASFNAQLPPENQKSKMPLLLAILAGLTVLSLVSLYLLSQQQTVNIEPNQSMNGAMAADGSTQAEENASVLPTDRGTSEENQASDSLGTAVDLDTVVGDVVANILESSDEVDTNGEVNVDLIDSILNESEVEKADSTAANPDWLAPYNRYRDPESRFSLEVPTLWRRNVSAKSVNFDSGEPFARIFVRDMGTINPDRSPELLIQQYIDSNANSFNNLAIIENSSKRIKNGYLQQEYGAVWLNKEVTLTLIAISGKEKSYILGLVAESEIGAEISASFEGIVNSFILNSPGQSTSGEQADSTVAVVSTQADSDETLIPTPLQTATRIPLPTRTTPETAASIEISPPTSTPVEPIKPTVVVEDDDSVSGTDTSSVGSPVSTSEIEATEEPEQEITTVLQPTSVITSTPVIESATIEDPTRSSTVAPTATAEPTATALPTIAVVPTAAATILDFEEFGSWELGTQPWGTFTQSTQQFYSGEYAGQFIYDFPASAANQNYLAFFRTVSIEGEPDALSLQVYGDGSGVYLHAWITDATDRVWQFTFGNIEHVGWQEMVAPLSLERGWPNGLIGSNAATTSTIQYPIAFSAFSVDGLDNDTLQRGTIYVDNLMVANAPVSGRPVPNSATEGASSENDVVQSAQVPTNIQIGKNKASFAIYF